ncbi:MAG: hypothetical protein CMI54_06365 [Parcubacteria group bacterium]|jgi:hypothetical protein|nr:hypothetical protein [Parcubacteria group bacterium]|tara:strand:- start:6456 stop:6941 length:486 start_codon:yes stop_codon:yes gene_type:complete
MRTSKTIGKLRFYFGFDRMTSVTGVNSALPKTKAGDLENYHLLMWDFDGVKKRAVHDSLKRIQRRRNLPPIYVLGTGRPDSYHAYCFSKHKWEEAFLIVWQTKKVCSTFVKMGFVRGYFTLRFSPKSGRAITFDSVLKSSNPETVNPYQLKSFVQYLTKGG